MKVNHTCVCRHFLPAALRWLVLDEADRLLDLGFEAKLRQITELINKRSGTREVAVVPAASPQQSPQRRYRDSDAVEGDEEGSEGDGEGDDGHGQQEDRRRVQPSDGGVGVGGRQTVLLSATLHRQLGVLAELALKDPALVGFEMSPGQVSARPGCGRERGRGRGIKDVGADCPGLPVGGDDVSARGVTRGGGGEGHPRVGFRQDRAFINTSVINQLRCLMFYDSLPTSPWLLPLQTSPLPPLAILAVNTTLSITAFV